MHTKRFAAVAVIAQLMVGACSTLAVEGGSSAEDLMASVQATTGAEAVAFTLQVTNISTAPVELTFPTGQSFDFSVMRGDEEIWQWSADQVFTQAVRVMTVPAGETVRYEAVWMPPEGAAGEYIMIGSLTADRFVRQAAAFRLP